MAGAGSHTLDALGIALVERLELARYRYLQATRAELLRRLDRIEDARAAYGRALQLVHSDAERRFLQRRLADGEVDLGPITPAVAYTTEGGPPSRKTLITEIETGVPGFPEGDRVRPRQRGRRRDRHLDLTGRTGVVAPPDGLRCAASPPAPGGPPP